MIDIEINDNTNCYMCKEITNNTYIDQPICEDCANMLRNAKEKIIELLKSEEII